MTKSCLDLYPVHLNSFHIPASRGRYCARVGRALDEQSSLLLDECLSYDEAAGSEEQRVESIRRALSGLVDNSSVDGDADERSVVEWCVMQIPVWWTSNLDGKSLMDRILFTGHWSSSTRK